MTETPVCFTQCSSTAARSEFTPAAAKKLEAECNYTLKQMYNINIQILDL